MVRRGDDENWLEEAFRDDPRPQAAGGSHARRAARSQARPVAPGDEDNWLDAAFSDEQPPRRSMSRGAKAAVAAAVVAAFVLVAVLAIQAMNVLTAGVAALAA